MFSGRPTASENTGRGKKPNSKNKKSNQVSEQKATLGEPAKNATSPAKPELFRSHLKMMTKYFGDYSDIIVKLASLNMEILKQFTDVDGIFRQALQQSKSNSTLKNQLITCVCGPPATFFESIECLTTFNAEVTWQFIHRKIIPHVCSQAVPSIQQGFWNLRGTLLSIWDTSFHFDAFN